MKTSDLVRLTKASRQTLYNWKKNKPDLYEVVQIGCKVKLNQETKYLTEITNANAAAGTN